MEKQEQAKPVRGQNLLEWYEALISAALALVLIGTIGSAGILVAACAAEDTMGSAVNRLCELHLIVPLVLGIVILLIGLLMLLPQVWPVNLLERPAEGEEKAAASDSKEA